MTLFHIDGKVPDYNEASNIFNNIGTITGKQSLMNFISSSSQPLAFEREYETASITSSAVTRKIKLRIRRDSDSRPTVSYRYRA